MTVLIVKLSFVKQTEGVKQNLPGSSGRSVAPLAEASPQNFTSQKVTETRNVPQGTLPQPSMARQGSANSSSGKSVLFAVPDVTVRPDQVFALRDVGVETATPAPRPTTGKGRLQLSLPESNLVQEGIRRVKTGLLSFAGGSVAGRFFLGSGVAVFIGAATLMVLGPDPQVLPVQPKTARVSRSATVAAVPTEQKPDTQPQIELTVSTSERPSGPEPAEYIDPFTPENQVPAKHVHAVYAVDHNNPNSRALIHQASRQKARQRNAAELMGTIEADEDDFPTPTLNPLRNHERSRSRDR